MFDYNHYVPVLRWKNAEKKALVNIPIQFKQLVTPLIELLPQRKDYQNFTTEILGGWDSGLFVDASLYENQQITVLQNIASNNRWNVIFIPVIHTFDSQDFIKYAVDIANNTASGICLRLYRNDLNNHTSKDISSLINKFKINESEVDLVVDLKFTDNSTSQLINNIPQLIPCLKLWRSFTLINGSFPPDLTQFHPDKIKYDLPRNDWLLWYDSITKGKMVRIPAFGDYTIQHALLNSNDNLRGSCSIRYTFEDHWLILRGRKPNAELGLTFDQYLGHAKMLIKDPRYKGETFSKGDKYIMQQAKGKIGIDPPGNAETWLEAGINHHITLTVNQIANLP